MSDRETYADTASQRNGHYWVDNCSLTQETSIAGAWNQTLISLTRNAQRDKIGTANALY